MANEHPIRYLVGELRDHLRSRKKRLEKEVDEVNDLLADAESVILSTDEHVESNARAFLKKIGQL